jgi:RecA-family ATPase
LLNVIAKIAVLLELPEVELNNSVLQTFKQSGMFREDKLRTIVNHAIPKAIANAYQSTISITQIKESIKLPRLALADGMIQFSNNPPPPRDYVLQDLIVASKVSVLAGLGGVSKTMLMMQWAVCIALGLSYMEKKTLSGAVMLILGEEDTDEIARRFNAIAVYMQLTPNQIRLVHERVLAFPMNGLDARLTRKIAGSLESTEFTAEVVAASKALEAKAGIPVRIIGLDHAGLIHGGEFNTREDVVQTMRQVNYIAQETKASVLVLAHSPKTAIAKDKSDSADVAGSAAWVDLARAVFVLRTMSDDEGKNFGISPNMRRQFAALSVVKNNYGPTGDTYWLERSVVKSYEVSVLQPANLVKPLAPVKGSGKLQALIISKIKQYQGKYSKSGFRDAHQGKSGPLKASKSDIDIAINELLNKGELILRTPTDTERKAHGIHHQTKSVLEAK